MPRHVPRRRRPAVPHATRPAAAAYAAALVALAPAACGGPPDYADDVAGLLHAECASCHRSEGPAPFPLLTYEQVAPHAAAIAAAVSERRMPPWLPAEVGPELAGERRLTDRQIATLVAWAEAGAPAGDLAAAPEAPAWPSGWALGEPDLVVEMPEPFEVPAAGPDQFRNFVLPVPTGGTRWVRAVELRPDNPRVVHHATMRVDPTPSSRLADAADPLPGYDEMFSRSEARAPGGLFLGWTPGRIPAPFPDGMGWTLEPGTDFVVQLHLRPTGEPEQVRARVGLYFTDEPPRQTPLIVRLGGQTMSIPAGDSAYVVEDAFRLPVAVQALGAYPHAHYLGRSMEAWAEPPGAEPFPLMSLPSWNFNWQDAYRYAEPVDLPAGTTLRLRWTFDNTAANPLNPHHPPERVVYGPGSADEMAELWLQVVPSDGQDLAPLAGAIAEKDRIDRVEGWEFLIGVDATDADAHYGLGTVAQERGEPYTAARHYERALASRPDFAQAHFNLGLIREDQGRPGDALAHFRAATEAFPLYASAWSALGRVLALRGERAEALAALERAVAADSTHADALNNLGGLLRDLDRPAEAEGPLRRALASRPAFPAASFNLAFVLVELGRAEEALEALNAGLAGEPANVGAALGIAWRLATAAEPEVRRPEVAAALADQIRAGVGPAPAAIDAQAAAHAAAGRFERAVALAREGVAAARNAGDAPRAEAMERRLRLYESGQAYVEPGG